MELRLQDLPTQASTQIPNSGIQRVYEYLGARGIKTAQEIESLRLRVLRCADIGKGGDDRAAIVFPHFDPSGNEIDWWSARLVDLADPTGFSALVPRARGKMYCPPKEAPAAYLVPTLNWSEMPEGAEVFIHESCIKAYAGARCGRYSIGLNGVWGWGSKKHDIALVPQIRDLPWAKKKLKCVIVFDSNAEDNDEVALAIRRLAERMRLICKVEVQHRLLPKSPEGTNWGFDDFVERHGIEAGRAFLDADEGRSVVDLSEVEMLKLQLNEEVCIVRELKKVAVQDSGVLMGRTDFCDINYADMTAWVQEGEREKQVNVPRLWLQWDHRKVVDRIEYMPGKGRIHDGCLNMWRGMGVEPSTGDVGLWLRILQHNVSEEGLRKWILQWMAYPLQNIGAKLNTFLHLYGPPGTGKQAILYPLMRIYGHNAVTIGREDIASDFNSQYTHKQFINIDELHGGASEIGQKINNRVKRVVTQDTMLVNRKGDPAYEVRNCAQVVTTSNYVDSIKLDEDDRRACVVKFGSRGNQLDGEFWHKYFKWVDSGGAGDVYGYLLGVDMEGFDPRGWAYSTEEKEVVVASGRQVVEQWVADLWDDPDGVLPAGVPSKQCLFTNDELAMWAFADDPNGVTPAKRVKLGLAMHSAGFQRLVLKLRGKTTKVWIVREKGRNWDEPGVAVKHMNLFASVKVSP